MTTNSKDVADILDAVTNLREEVRRLNQRVAKLEAAQLGSAEKLVGAAAQQQDEELLAVIGAAVAAYLGVEPHIRQIRLIRDATWLQIGRATIQASHAINVHHG